MNHSLEMTQTDKISYEIENVESISDEELGEKENEEKHLQILMAVVPIVVPIIFHLSFKYALFIHFNIED